MCVWPCMYVNFPIVLAALYVSMSIDRLVLMAFNQMSLGLWEGCCRISAAFLWAMITLGHEPSPDFIESVFQVSDATRFVWPHGGVAPWVDLIMDELEKAKRNTFPGSAAPTHDSMCVIAAKLHSLALSAVRPIVGCLVTTVGHTNDLVVSHGR